MCCLRACSVVRGGLLTGGGGAIGNAAAGGQRWECRYIATLIALKKEVEEHTGKALKLTIASASEAHLVADELAEAGVGVIVTPARPFVSVS